MIEVRGVVQNSIEPTELRLDRSGKVLEVAVARRGKIERQDRRLCAAGGFDLVVHRLELDHIASMQDHRRAVSRERERRDAAYASAGSGDEQHSVFEQVWWCLVLTERVHELEEDLVAKTQRTTMDER